MSNNFLGEIKLLPYDWPPKGWALCAGQLLPIASNQALFSLLGTTYGGNGTTNFALPDLRGRVPAHPSGATPSGTVAGAESVTLTSLNLPAHNHLVSASTTPANNTAFDGNYIASGATGTTAVSVYGDAVNLQPLNQGTVSLVGGGQPHENCQPSLVLNYCIALTGTFPSRN